jgi:hypothetical protein
MIEQLRSNDQYEWSNVLGPLQDGWSDDTADERKSQGLKDVQMHLLEAQAGGILLSYDRVKNHLIGAQDLEDGEWCKTHGKVSDKNIGLCY